MIFISDIDQARAAQILSELVSIRRGKIDVDTDPARWNSLWKDAYFLFHKKDKPKYKVIDNDGTLMGAYIHQKDADLVCAALIAYRQEE